MHGYLTRQCLTCFDFSKFQGILGLSLPFSKICKQERTLQEYKLEENITDVLNLAGG
jgi:hypothetical protein